MEKTNIPVIHGDTTEAKFHTGVSAALRVNGVQFFVMTEGIDELRFITNYIMGNEFELNENKVVPTGLCKLVDITEF